MAGADHVDLCGGVLDLIVRERHAATTPEAKNWLLSFLGEDHHEPISRPARQDKPVVDVEWKHRLALTIWQETVPAPGTTVDLWLRDRGLRWAIHPRIRCHRRLPYFHDGAVIGEFPAMVLRLDDEHGNFVGIQRTWLTTGGGKANVPSPRMTLGTQGVACAAWLGRCDISAIIVGEGVETVMSASELGGEALPTWGCCREPDGGPHKLVDMPPEPWGLNAGSDVRRWKSRQVRHPAHGPPNIYL